jgi:hypothetical protein
MNSKFAIILLLGLLSFPTLTRAQAPLPVGRWEIVQFKSSHGKWKFDTMYDPKI